MPAATDFRRIADEIGRQGVALIERGELEGGEMAEFLRDMAQAGKAAVEAAQASEMGPGPITRALEGLHDELLEAGFAPNEVVVTDVEVFLATVLRSLGDLRRAREQSIGGLVALEEAYKIVAGRLLFTTEQAEAADNDTSRRVAAGHRRAIVDSVNRLSDAGLSIPIEARRA